MANVKKGLGKPSIKKQSESSERACISRPAFSFVHLCNYKNHTFDRFDASGRRDKEKAYALLVEILVSISKHDWVSISAGTTNIGIEYLDPIIKKLRPEPSGYSFARDEKFISIRFGPADCYRLLCFRPSTCPILHVFGIDFDHTAYDHGS